MCYPIRRQLLTTSLRAFGKLTLTIKNPWRQNNVAKYTNSASSIKLNVLSMTSMDLCERKIKYRRIHIRIRPSNRGQVIWWQGEGRGEGGRRDGERREGV